MPKKPVAVVCDLAGTFDNGWTGAQPAWTVEPESLKCRKGNHLIIWSLSAQNVPQGFDAAFPDPGIAFKPTPAWPGGAPQNEPDGKVTATNDFRGAAKTVKYNYTVSVTATPDPGTPYPSQTFSYDPDVENDIGGGDDGKPAGAQVREAKPKKARRTTKPKAKAKTKARPKAKKVQKAKKKAGQKR